MSDALPFSKYQATGNDFVMVFDPEDRERIAPERVATLCDRRFGIGADGLIRVVASDDPAARWRMDYRNADGSVAEMCGNGIRCVAALLTDRRLETGGSFAVVSRAGVHELTVEDDGPGRRVTVSMGPANFTRAAIPMLGPAWETFLEQPIEVGDLTLRGSAVSMGNPHLVLLLEEDPDRYHVSHIGPALARDGRFPEGVNVEFARPSDGEIVARVWERGSGETMACGSGACAIAVAANEAGLAPPRVRVRFPGGVVEVERTDTDVLLRGGAEHVFDGSVELEGR